MGVTRGSRVNELSALSGRMQVIVRARALVSVCPSRVAFAKTSYQKHGAHGDRS